MTRPLGSVKCHKEISNTEISPGHWRIVVCNRPDGHKGRHSVKGDCHLHPGRVQGHRDCEWM